MRKLLLGLIAFMVFLETKGSIVSDLDNLLSDQEIQQIRTRCEKIEQEHQINFQIHFYSDPFDAPQFSKVNTGSSPLVFVSVNRADTTVKVNTKNLNATRTRFFENVFFQFLNVPLREGSSLLTSLNSTLNEIESSLIQRQQIIEQNKIEDELYDSFDPRATTFLWIFFWVIVIFGIVFFTKKARVKNKHEARSFYGISRLPRWFTIILGGLVLIGGSYFISGYISYGVWVVKSVFWLAFYPIMVFLTYFTTIVIDLFSLKEFNTEDTQLTLGQKLWLVRPSANTEHLMELTFYEQVFRKNINLEIVSEEIHRRRVHEYYVSPGENFDQKAKHCLAEKPFFELLDASEEPLEPYLHRIYEHYGNFLSFRKDSAIKGMFKSGLITRFGYLTNTFILTTKGKELQRNLRKTEEQQARLIDEGMQDPAQIPAILPQLTTHLLLVNDFERQLTHFYNVIVEMGLLNKAIALPIGLLFHPDFSLRSFNVKLRSAYASGVVNEASDDGSYWDMDF